MCRHIQASQPHSPEYDFSTNIRQRYKIKTNDKKHKGYVYIAYPSARPVSMTPITYFRLYVSAENSHHGKMATMRLANMLRPA